MAITSIIAATTEAVVGEDAEFTTAARGFWLVGSGFRQRRICTGGRTRCRWRDL